MSKPFKPLSLPAPLRLLRLHHWVKSGFVAAPLFFTPSALSAANLLAVALGMLAWSLLASAIYILNDWKDVEADRLHPVKQTRPLASGAVSPHSAFVIMGALVIVGSVMAIWLSFPFFCFLMLYAILNLLYSLRLKHVAIIDVMCISLGFVLRVEAGGVLIGVEPSSWIVILTGLLALFLGFAKRRDDIVKLVDTGHRKSLDGYSRAFIDLALSITLGASLVSYLIYTTDPDVRTRLGSDHLYYTVPFVIYAMLRYLQLAIVKERSGSPTLVVLTDKPILVAGIGWLLTFAWLIYRS